MVADKGHAAGKRLRDYAGFGDPSSKKNALLIECGQHWEKSSADVALASSLRFLQATGAVSSDFGAETLASFGTPSAQRFVEVVQPVTIETDAFRFVRDFKGMEVIEKAGTVIAHDGDKPVTAPVDGTVLIMPGRRLDKGMTAVRLGRYIT